MPTYTSDELRAALESAANSRKLAEFVGQNLVVNGFREETGQYGTYVIIDAVTLEGDEVTISSGGKVVIPQLRKLESLEAFPVEVVVVEFPGQFGKMGQKFEVA